jgi:hypothetical protein
MSRRPTAYLTVEELKQMAAIKFNEAESATGPEQQKILVSARGYRNLAEMNGTLHRRNLNRRTKRLVASRLAS